MRGREMSGCGSTTTPRATRRTLAHAFQPIPCMHCETRVRARCRRQGYGAQRRGAERHGLNRCVGTKYCANNCPYKVRRFNFYHWDAVPRRGMRMLANPDVTVRWRGVMEKCTYCVQRINEGKTRSSSRTGGCGTARSAWPAAGVPRRGDRLRRSRGSAEPRLAPAAIATLVRPAGGARHAPAHDHLAMSAIRSPSRPSGECMSREAADRGRTGPPGVERRTLGHAGQLDRALAAHAASGRRLLPLVSGRDGAPRSRSPGSSRGASGSGVSTSLSSGRSTSSTSSGGLGSGTPARSSRRSSC